MKLLVAFLLLVACSVSSANSNPPEIVVSIKPVHSLVTGLMKDVGTPVLLIKDPQTPYDFTITATQTAQLNAAKLVIWVGPELEKTPGTGNRAIAFIYHRCRTAGKFPFKNSAIKVKSLFA